MSTTVRLLPYAVAGGSHNMAADEVLLEAAAAGRASLRFYGWSEATLSLGYFQPQRVRHSDPRLATLPFVRRPSGGATLVHHHELTYALALPAGVPWQGAYSWLCQMHKIVAAALGEFGVASRLHTASKERHTSTVLCFQQFTDGDLLIGAAKVVGSAQRRQRGALMQHGGILLAGSPATPLLPGVEELSGQRIAPDALCSAVSRSFVGTTGWELKTEEWTQDEKQRLLELARIRYGEDSWNCKR